MVSTLFDSNFYRLANADLANLSDSQAWEHFQAYGAKENRLFSPFVNLDLYLKLNPDVNQVFNGDKLRSLEHLETQGINEQRIFSEFFDLQIYLQNNPDVRNAYQNNGLQALQHFSIFGINEDRIFSIPLDLDFYRNTYPDLSTANLSNRQLFEHFQLLGLNEQRASSSFFNASYYLANNTDLQNAGLNLQQAYQHFVSNGWQEGRTGTVGNNIIFNGVSAGDTTQTSAILWTRTGDFNNPQQGKASDVILQVSSDPQFSTIHSTFVTETDPSRDYTVKVDHTTLQSNSRYYYRFMAPGGQVSGVGTFKTAPAPTEAVPVRMAFSGDTAGEWRPYGLTKDFNSLNLDFFIYLGDAIYETKSGNEATGVGLSPATADPLTNPTQALADYRRKYLENFAPVIPGQFPSLQRFYSSQANYTLLDNHELGSNQFTEGGAPAGNPPGTGGDPTNPANDVNTTGTYIHSTPGFKAMLQAYKDYTPIRETVISAPNDPRTDGTQQLYNAQQWGANAIFIQTDNRSYRDIRIKETNAEGRLVDATGDRADNPERTMLGETQLQWLKDTLLKAETDGVPWKIISVASPIDEAGSSSGNKIIPLDTGKTWIGGYRAERNEILKFIDDNDIKNVVFLTTDDHENRVNELTYFDEVTGDRIVVPNTFTIVAGPLGAFGPGIITDQSFGNIKSIADGIVAQQIEKGVNPLGLDPNFPGLQNVFREGDPDANQRREPVDFYSPDTFNYVTLDVSADGKKLAVNTYGIDPYPTNSFTDASLVEPARRILGFEVLAAV